MSDLLRDRHFAFNIWDLESARAVMDAAALCNEDVILQTSVAIYKRINTKVFPWFVKAYAREIGINTWINLDHCKDNAVLKDAIDNGWDMVMADGSVLDVKSNIAFVNDIVQYAHDNKVYVEAEVGQIKGVEDDIKVREESVASEEDIKEFIENTDVDFVAVAFGNAHGEYVGKPTFRYDLIDFTIDNSNKPFVVHGASGMSEVAIDRLLNIDGVKKINISTDVKNAYRRGVENIDVSLQPIEISEVIHDEIVKEVINKLNMIK